MKLGTYEIVDEFGEPIDELIESYEEAMHKAEAFVAQEENVPEVFITLTVAHKLRNSNIETKEIDWENFE